MHNAFGLGGLIDPLGNLKAEDVMMPQQACAGVNRAVPTAAVPTAPTAPVYPTVGEVIRNNIAMAQAEIKRQEAIYLEAKRMGILQEKIDVLRSIIGW